MFEIVQLEQLLCIHKCGTVSKAAEELHLSQSAVSRSIQKLESDLQVSLFTRQKNKIELNENGKLAVDLAAKLLDQAYAMTTQLRNYDRSQRTISIGSCAPAPLWEIPPMLSDIHTEMTISSEIKDTETLLQGLNNDLFHMIVLPYPIESEKYICTRFGEEHLYFSLPPAHPMSSSKSLRFKDLNGETMLLRSRIGFWQNIHDTIMPDTHFLVQEWFAFDELVKSSALPSFTSDLVMKRSGMPSNRIAVPITDEEASVTYYCVHKPKHHRLFHEFFQQLAKSRKTK